MKRRRRTSELKLNFDGLADSVTNLVGAIILLVVIVIGVTQEAFSQTQASPQPAETKETGERSIQPLQQRLISLQVQLQQVEGEIQQINSTLNQTESRIDELLDRVKDIDIKPPAPVEEEKNQAENVKEVPFRPPLAKVELDRQSISYVVQNGMLYHLDFEALNEKLSADALNHANNNEFSFVVSYIIGSFKIAGPVKTKLVGRKLGIEESGIEASLVDNPNGESIADALKPKSKYLNKIASLDPSRFYVEFIVYSDNFNNFRSVREIAFSNNLDVGWSPIGTGEPLKLGKGIGSSQ